MNLPGTAALNTIGQIASHNTYTNSDWSSHFKSVNAIELDVWPLHNWIGSHVFDVGAGNLDGYMSDLATWRAAHRNHDLLTVFIEIKSGEGWKVPHFESILLSQVQRSEMFCPMDLVEWGKENGAAR
jgi:hypothetical protein